MPRCRVSDRELDRRLHDAASHLLDFECPGLAAAVREAHKRLFPLHCASCGELPHEGTKCRTRRKPWDRRLEREVPR